MKGLNGLSAGVEQTKFLGEDAVRASNNDLEITLIPEWGSNIISIIEKHTKTELLRIPDSADQFWEAPVLYGTPILFPPNRIEDGKFAFLERSYQFDINEQDKNNHIHGFVHTRPWKVTKAEAMNNQAIIETTFDSQQFPEVQRQFPHHFIINMKFILEGNTLTKSCTIINKGEQSFPWGLGYHTAFVFPEDSSTFALSAEKRWTLNKRFLPTGELEDFPFRENMEKGMSLKSVPLDDVFLAAKSGENKAVLFNKQTGIEIAYKVDDNFKHWVVYNNDGNHQFVCPEPYTWVTNAPNLDLPASLTGIQVMEPNEEKTIQTQLIILIKN